MRYPTATADLSNLPLDPTSEEITLSLEESHHLARVLRMRVGDQIAILCPVSKRRFTTTITRIDKLVVVKIEKEEANLAYRSRVSFLLFALCKGEKTDLVVEKACELGVSNLIIWGAERSVVQIKSAQDCEKKLVRWNKIALSAAKQCGTQLCTTVSFCQNLGEALSADNEWNRNVDSKFACSLEEGARELRTVTPSPTSSVLVIGPEGDISQTENQVLKAAGFTNVTLGPLTLRAETAAITGVAAFNALYGFIPNNP